MSDKQNRTIQQIQQEYQELCLKAGHFQYQIYTMGRDLELVNKELRDLNLEAAAVKAAEVKAQVEAQKDQPAPPSADPQPTQSGAV